MSLLPKIESIFSIIIALGKMWYKFENGVLLKVLEKLIIVVTNLLVSKLKEGLLELGKLIV